MNFTPQKVILFYQCPSFSTLKDVANGLNMCGFNAIIFGAKRGEHKCWIKCEDLSINLENIIIDTGKKRFGFSKCVYPWEKNWSGYYVGGWIK